MKMTQYALGSILYGLKGVCQHLKDGIFIKLGCLYSRKMQIFLKSVKRKPTTTRMHSQTSPTPTNSWSELQTLVYVFTL